MASTVVELQSASVHSPRNPPPAGNSGAVDHGMVSLKTGWKYLMKHGIQPLQASLEQSFPDAIHRLMENDGDDDGAVAAYLHNVVLKTSKIRIPRTYHHYDDNNNSDVKSSSSSSCSSDSSRLYTLVYKMAIQPPPHNHCAPLYKLVAGLLSAYVEKHVYEKLIHLLHALPADVRTLNRQLEEKNLIEAKSERSGNNSGGTWNKLFLPTFVVRWDLFRKFNGAVGMYFKYLNRYYVPHNELQDTETLGLHLFQTVVEAPLRERIVDEITERLGQVRHHPDSESAGMKLLSRTVNVFVELGVFADFEQLLLSKFSRSYEELGANLIQQQLTVFGFAEKASAIQSRELELIRSLLPTSSHKTFFNCFHNKCLGEALPVFMGDKSKMWTQFFSSVENTHHVEMLFNLFSDDPNGLSIISGVFEQSIAESGLNLVENQARNESKEWEHPDYDPHHHVHRDQLRLQFDYVEELIRLYDLFNHMVCTCFRNHVLFEEALKNGFRRILHKDVGATTNTEIIARFCDYVLNESHELLTQIRRADQAVEAYLDKLSALFSYSPDYDLFTFVYRQYLATRLLESRSHSEEAERSMIAKMKIRAGTRFTSRLEGMVNDMANSRVLNKDFHSCIVHRKVSAFSDAHASSELMLWMQDMLPVEVKVLTRGIWPTLRDRDIRPPLEFSHTAKLFQSFYEKSRERRTLKWAWELGTVTLAMRDYDNKVRHVIIATTLQAMVLCLFNEHESLKIQDICRVLHMDSWIGVRVLHSLCCGKNKVITKSGNPLIVSMGDRFQVNEDFTAPKMFVALPFPDLHEKSVVQASYDYTIPMKAFIVRTMKKEKSMRLSALIDLIMDSLERFRPELKMIAAVLDNLVENEFLERDEKDLYHYVP
eukprot:TRINITY_DN5967_c0_g2_i1.p1 TRINITY_DN5967_c0_g2~~TRINITY_DN5967_c0_g2_i1.p1  ORF type:complete len:880 (+),score=235.47 TRINITY_DN5967_c0_g2_i1:3-2642(+)